MTRVASPIALGLAVSLTLSCSSPGDKAADTEAIRLQVVKYTASLDAADPQLATEVWLTTPDVSFIHPAGHAHGWEEIKGIYAYWGASFTDRKLIARDIAVHLNGDSAWVEFYWHYTAKQSKDGKAFETDGRETQIYNRIGTQWKLAHGHYSSPVTRP